MITASTELQNVLKNNTAVQISSGCTIEYNINDMVNSPTVTSTYAYDTINNYKPFTNLFPYSSVVEPVRPERCGIKYIIFGDSQIATNEYRNPKTIKYNSNIRTYYPGIDNRYKYFISNKNQAVGLSIAYAKTVFVNKVVIKFELGHSTPTSGTVTLKLTGSTVANVSFTNSDIKAFGENDAGAITIYYNGTSWSKTESNLNTSSYVSINQVDLAVSAVSGKKYIGVIEISPKFVLDISSDIESFETQSESSYSIDDIAPVGSLTANSLSLTFNRYDKSTLKVLTYDKSSTTFTADRLYLYINAKLKPHFKIYHSSGAYGTTPNKYDIVEQGIFFVNSWRVDQNGDTSLFALDGAKILQDTICPDIVCEEYSLTAIIRYLLDSIGFTNYNINLNSTDSAENGIISPRFWWSEDNTTVWQAIQEICTDAQMIATFDNKNILQFYSRDYLYNASRTENWRFYYQQNTSSDPLPNIISLTKNELPSGNKVRVLWQSITSSRYEQDGGPLWKSPTTFLSAAALTKDISSSDAAGSYMSFAIITEDKFESQDWFYSFNGYILLDSEIIEYDAIQFQYKDDSTKTWFTKDISDITDLLKYRSYAEPGPGNFISTGKYRIKNRAVFNTGPAADHKVDPKNTVSGWTSAKVLWD